MSTQPEPIGHLLRRIATDDVETGPGSDLDYSENLLLFVDNQVQDEHQWAPLWAPRFSRLHRINLADINHELAALKKTILENSKVSKRNIKKLRRLLDAQATALRNYEYVESLDCFNKKDRNLLQEEAQKYFPDVSIVQNCGERPFSSGAYRYVARREEPYPHGDQLRHWLCNHLPVQFTYSKQEKSVRRGDYRGNIVPLGVGENVETLARLIIALFGAVSIIVPMIIMSLDQSRTKSLVTTSVAVILFAICCSLTLHTSNDQTLAATAGYAAVLMVFVGLTT